MPKNTTNLINQEKKNFVLKVILLVVVFNLFTTAWSGLTYYNIASLVLAITIIFLSISFLYNDILDTEFWFEISKLLFELLSKFYLSFSFIKEAVSENKTVIKKDTMLEYNPMRRYKPSFYVLVLTGIGLCIKIYNEKCVPSLQAGFAGVFFGAMYCAYKMHKIKKDANKSKPVVKKNKMLSYDPTSARVCFIFLLIATTDMFLILFKIIFAGCIPYYRVHFAIIYFIVFSLIFALKIFAKQKEYYFKKENTKVIPSITVEEIKQNPVIIEQHPFHILAASALPFFTSLFTFDMLFFTVKYFHYGWTKYIALHLTTSISGLILTLTIWFLSIIKESNEGHHTKKVRWNLLHGMMLFIVSEIMLFFSIFWAFFHSSLSPSVAIYCMWPPLGIETINPWHLPFLNTVVLLSSGVSLTYAHVCLVAGEYKLTSRGLLITLGYGVFFSFVQLFEYINAPFSINDGIYGSIFFLSTGFHGLHVIIGSIMLLVNLIRNGLRNLLPSQHVGFTSAAWYWHFVDVVWLFLFLSIYWWGS